MPEEKSKPDWWNPYGDGGYPEVKGWGVADDGFLHQSDREATNWAILHGLVPGLAGLAPGELEALRLYTTDPHVYKTVTDMQFDGLSCALIELMRRGIERVTVPQGLVAWRAAGYRLFEFAVNAKPITGKRPDLTRAEGGVFDHRAFVSATIGSSTLAAGLGHYEVQYKLRIEPGVHAIAVLDTWGKDQRELLIQAGVQYRIEKVERIDRTWFVQARIPAAGET